MDPGTLNPEEEPESDVVMTVRRHQVRPLINEVDETNFEEEVGHRNTSQELIAQLYHDDCVDEG